MFNSYETMLKLVEQKLATVSVNGNLSTFKYHRRVMFDNLWNQHPETMECRGHTYDNTTGELVVATPRKSFNYLENGWWSDKSLETPVIAYKKYNGFMACVSKVGALPMISTTGSTKSDFVQMAEKYLLNKQFLATDSKITHLFEIVHPDDPHIVDELVGSHHLGYRDKKTGAFTPYGKTKDIYLGTLKGILEIAEVNTGEGFMVYDLHNDPNRIAPAKVKTPYYIGKKRLMRASKKHVELMYTDSQSYSFNHLPEMWRNMPKYICGVYEKEHWISLSDQERRKVLETFEGVLI